MKINIPLSLLLKIVTFLGKCSGAEPKDLYKEIMDYVRDIK